jgi:hypothetical protein
MVGISRIFPTWGNFMHFCLKEEFPMPKAADMEGRVSYAWRDVFGQNLVRMIMDGNEYNILEPSSGIAART